MATVEGNEEDQCAHCQHERGAHDDVWGCGAHEYHTNGDCNCHKFEEPDQYDDDHCLDCGHERLLHLIGPTGCNAEVVASLTKDEDSPKLRDCECKEFVERNDNKPYTPDSRI